MASKRTDPASEVLTLNGVDLKQMMQAGMAWLERHYEEVNALNVFPVPDGDTGTNMLLTMRSACNEIAGLTDLNAGVIAQKSYNGALMGARGNSGVILSQLLRGFAHGIGKQESFDAKGLVAGFLEAASMAYKAVQEPVEGTMLTVAREGADAAAQAEHDTDDIVEILAATVAECHASVERTPQLLNVLAEAGVVDSGGMGLTFILEGMLRQLRGEVTEVGDVPEAHQALQSALTPEDELGYGYDVQFLIKGTGMDVDRIRADIEAMGESTLVVGDENLVKVHVHVHNPGVPVGYGADQGILADVVVENMQEQYEEFLRERGGPQMPAAESIEPPRVEAGTVSAVTVAPGDGFTRIFYSLGAGRVVAGGQTMNPSTKDILEAINALPTDRVIVLPNNKNIVMAANQAAEQANGKDVRVVATTTIPQGISALLSLDPQGELDDLVESMIGSIKLVETGEVTTSTRSARINGVKVKEGQIIGLHNDQLSVAGDEINAVVLELLDNMGTEELELITLYYGIDVSEGDAMALVEQLQETYPEHEIEVRDGGQPHYFYILSAE